MALIACEECGRSISDRAPSCPHCGAPSATVPPPIQQPTAAAIALTKADQKSGFGRKVFISLFAIVALIIIIGQSRETTTVGDKNTPPSGASRTSQTNPPPQKELLRASAQELFDAYESNEVATDLRLKSKIIEVSGRVQSINKNAFDSMYVSLETRNQFMPTNVHPNKQDESKIAGLRRGQSVVFRCQRFKRWVGSPSGDDCVLID
jgi:hypothetical protein